MEYLHTAPVTNTHAHVHTCIQRLAAIRNVQYMYINVYGGAPLIWTPEMWTPQ